MSGETPAGVRALNLVDVKKHEMDPFHVRETNGMTEKRPCLLTALNLSSPIRRLQVKKARERTEERNETE